MTFSIVTPSFQQIEWLRLCVASVRDQAGPPAAGRSRSEAPESNARSPISSPLHVEHLIQDAGSPGIEDFAREVGADFYRDGALVFAGAGDRGWKIGERTSPSAISDLQPSTPLYRIAIHCEPDGGMYDAINRGLAKSSGEICAWLNCDEQYLPGTLGHVAGDFQAANPLDVLLGDALILSSTLRPLCYRRIMVPSLWHTRLHHLHSLSCAMFFRRDALPDPPLDPGWRIIGDLLLMDYFLAGGKKIRAVHHPLSTYALTGVNLGSSTEHGEHARWLKQNNYHAPALKVLSFVAHLFRRLLHGSYGRFRVRTQLYTFQSPGRRVELAGIVSGAWPRVYKR